MSGKSNPFPCYTCHGQCCGPVSINKKEFDRLQVAVNKMKPQERKRLQQQQRPEDRCIFYDMDHRKCSVYAFRPEMCRMIGYYEALECQTVPEDDYPIPLKGVKEGMDRIRQNEDGAVGVLSRNTFWRDFL